MTPAALLTQLGGLDGRDQVCRELGLSDWELNKNTPLLLELVRRGRHGDKPDVPSEVRWFCWVLQLVRSGGVNNDQFPLFVSAGGPDWKQLEGQKIVCF